jgi:hypothetical protein
MSSKGTYWSVSTNATSDKDSDPKIAVSVIQPINSISLTPMKVKITETPENYLWKFVKV